MDICYKIHRKTNTQNLLNYLMKITNYKLGFSSPVCEMYFFEYISIHAYACTPIYTS